MAAISASLDFEREAASRRTGFGASATTLKLDSEMVERVKRVADAKQRTAEAIVREAVEEYISRSEARDEMLRAGIAAWEHYKTTGLHVTGEEMEEWMLKIEAGEDIPPPECHT